jgi:hypothetical protein
LHSTFDCFVDALACSRSVANETFHELALTIENKRLRDHILIGKQKGCEIFVRRCERVLNPELLCECRDLLLVAWTTDIESYNDHSIVFMLLL